MSDYFVENNKNMLIDLQNYDIIDRRDISEELF